MTIKGWQHTGLVVRNLDQAIRFYREAFGFEVVFEERNIGTEIADITGVAGQSCDLAQLRCPFSDHMLELLQFHRFDASAPPEPICPLRPGQAHTSFHVDSLDDAIRHVASLGAEMIGVIAEFPEGRAVYCREPSGTFFELSELRMGPA